MLVRLGMEFGQTMVPVKVRLLLLEDSESDGELLLMEMRGAGFEPEWTRVADRAGYLDQLIPDLDLILADYNLPQFNGRDALHLLNQTGYDIPFIIVSGAIEEEIAIACMREGAEDYLFKNRLARLGASVTRALQRRAEREKLRRMEEALRKRDDILKAAAFAGEAFVAANDWRDAINAVLEKFGRAAQVDRTNLYQNAPSERGELATTIVAEWVAEGTPRLQDDPASYGFEYHPHGFGRWKTTLEKGETIFGNVLDFPAREKKVLSEEGAQSVVVVPVFVHQAWWGFIGFDMCAQPREWAAQEIDGLRMAAGALSAAIERHQEQENLRSTETRLQAVIGHAPIVIFAVDRNGVLTVKEGRAAGFFPPSAGDPTGKSIIELFGGNARIVRDIQKALGGARFSNRLELGSQVYEIWYSPNEGPRQNIIGAIGVVTEITARAEMEAALQRQLLEQSVLHAVAAATASASQLDDLIEKITMFIGETFSLENFGFGFLDETSQMVIPHPSYRSSPRAKAPLVGIDTGIVGKVLRTCRPLRLGDISLDDDYLVVEASTRSELCVPIRIDGRCMGVINAESAKPNHFCEEDERLLLTVADQFAVGKQKLELLAGSERQNRELRTLARISQSIRSASERAEMLSVLLEETCDAFEASGAALLSTHPDRKYSLVELGIGDWANWTGGRIPLGSGINGQVMQSGQAYISADLMADENFASSHLLTGSSAAISIPLIAQNETIGSLWIGCAQPFEETDSQFFAAVGDIAASALRRVTLYEQTSTRARFLAILNEITQLSLQARDFSVVSKTIASNLALLIGADQAAITTLGADERRIEALAYHGEDEALYRAIRLEPGEPSLTEIVLEQQRSIVVEDALDSPHISERVSRLLGLRSVLGLPLIFGEQKIGAILLGFDVPHTFARSEIAGAEQAAYQVALAIARNRALEAERRRRAELEALRQAGLLLTSNLELGPLLDTTLLKAIEITSADAAHIFLGDGAGLKFGSAYWDGRLQRLPRNAHDNSFVLEIARTGIAAVISNTLQSHLFAESTGEGALAGLPLLVDHAVGGVTIVSFDRVHHFTEDELRVLHLFADQAAVALKNARLFAESRTALHNMQALYQVSQASISYDHLADLLAGILNLVVETMDADRVLLLALDYPRRQITHYLKGGPGADVLFKDSFDELMDGLTGWVLRNGETAISPAGGADPRESPRLQERRTLTGGGSLVVAPIQSHGSILGTITIINAIGQREFTPEDAALLGTIANQTAIAIENANLIEDLRQSNERLVTAYDATIAGWARALEMRDNDTLGHSQRVTDLALQLARQMGLPEDQLEQMRRGAILHDIGKMGIPDEILLKPGALNEAE